MSTYTAIGSNSGGSATSLAMTLTGAVPAGGLIICRVGGSYAGNTVTVADSNSLTWTKDVEQLDAIFGRSVAIFSAPAPAGKASGQTITMSQSGIATNLALSSIYVANPAATPLDSVPTKAALAASAGTAASTGTTASPSTSDWVGCTVVTNDGPASATPQAGWTEDFDVSIGSLGYEAQSVIGTSTTAMRGAATLSASSDWTIAVAVYKLTSSSGTTAHNMTLLGVGA